jgi:exonuclease V gamma subunit
MMKPDPENLDDLTRQLRRREAQLDSGKHGELVQDQLRTRIAMLRDEIKLARWRDKQKRIRIQTGEMKCGED